MTDMNDSSVCLSAYYDGDNDTETVLACLVSVLQSQIQQQTNQQQQHQQQSASNQDSTTTSDASSSDYDDLASGLDAFFLIFSATLMFTMQAGFAMVCAGCVRQKNVQNTMMKNVLDCSGAALGFFVCGYALAYGGTNGTITEADLEKTTSTFAGNDNFFLMGDPNYAFWFYQFAFAATTCTIVAGCLAERVQMIGYFLYSLFVSAIVFPLIAHAIWSSDGLFNAYKSNSFLGVGVVDFAGAGVVHMTGGTISLVASLILGPRRGRFFDTEGNKLEHPVHIQGYSVPLQTLGTFLLWLGWYGFNGKYSFYQFIVITLFSRHHDDHHHPLILWLTY